MKELSERSKAIVERAKVHQVRCQTIGFLLGYDASMAFHKRFKGDPGSDQAKREFERLISTAEN